MISELTFRVPDELYPLADDRVNEVHERWSSYRLSDITKMMPTTVGIDVGATEVKIAPLLPKGDYDESLSIALFTAQSQHWSPQQYALAEVSRQVVAPNSAMYVFPNNSVIRSYYSLTREQRKEVASGNVAAIGEQFMKTLEALRLGRTALTGYSWGGLPAAAIAGIHSGSVELVGLNLDETPNQENPNLASDFLTSAGDLGAIVDDANLQAIASIQGMLRRYGLAYPAFGIANYLVPTGIATRRAMQHSKLIPMLEAAKSARPDLLIKLGRVTDSKIVKVSPQVEGLINRHPDVRLATYSGDGSHMHGTGINPMAYALMVKDGLGNLVKSQ